MLTETQHQTLAAVMDRLVPPDEFPGAWEAGAGEYLLRQFTGDLQGDVPVYRLGLDALDAEARAARGGSFVQLDIEAQDALLARVEAGNVTTDWPEPPARFFALVVRHTMEGFYADPGNGGNKNGVAWEMVGFEVRG